MKKVLFIALLALVSSYAQAGGDAGAGAQKAKPCAACHGADFNSPVSADIPRLAGQYEDYLARALSDYKEGTRKNPVMAGQAQALSRQDILDLAAYLASLPAKLKVIRLHRLVQ
jgi:cytochrome c553